MIKHLFVSFILFLIPIVADAEYIGSVDKRRYVTDTEKLQFPYNVVVRVDSGDSWSSGTFVSENVILTCRHCVGDIGLNNSVNFVTSDGKMHSGRVWFDDKPNTMDKDYAFIITDDKKYGEMPVLTSGAIATQNAMRIGYDALKVLDADELKVVKELSADLIGKYGAVTVDNFENVIGDIEYILKDNYACKSENDKNCVHCVGDGCIFSDGDRMKVQDSCNVTELQHTEDGGVLLHTQCAGSQGASGGPLIMNKAMLIGVIVRGGVFEIGKNDLPDSNAVMPEQFFDATRTVMLENRKR